MFLAPAFLFGLLAIGVPLWLHRFARETQDRQPFASLMLLEPSKTHRSRRHTLRYLLLLALRIGLLVALALAFAEPILRSAAAQLVGRASTLHVIVLDTSLSMQHGGRWERAIARARELMDDIGSADRAMLVAADHRVRIVHDPAGAGALEPLRAALASIKPGLARLDYGMLMTSSEAWIEANRQPVQLHLITDLQQSASPLRFADLGPPAGAQLRLVDVGADDATNLFVESARISDQDANAIEVRVNGTHAPGVKREVVVAIDGQERARKALDASVTGRQALTFTGLELGTGHHRVVASLEPRDGLPQDDQLYSTVDRVEPRVLLLAASTSSDDSAYLSAAISSLTSPRLVVDRNTPEGLDRRALADYAAVIVSDVGILSEESAQAVQRYIESGGAVLMTLGPRSASFRTLPLSGHELSTRAQAAASQTGRVSVVEESHPALREAQGWRSIRFFRHVAIEPRPEDTVLIRFEQGPPLLVEQRTGSGRLLVFASPLDREWNDLAIHPLFVRFIGEAARYLTGIGAGTTSATVGSILTAGLNGRTGAQIFDPSGRRVLNLGDTAAAPRLVPDQLGFYEVRGDGRAEWIAVNVDPRESDLARMSGASIDRWRNLPAPAVTAADASNASENEATRVTPVWLWFLMAAAALAIVEALVANYHLTVRREVTA